MVIFLFIFFTEVQQRLVDRPAGERRLRHRLHPQPTEAGKHPASAGAEKRSLPQVSVRLVETSRVAVKRRQQGDRKEGTRRFRRNGGVGFVFRGRETLQG